MAGTAKAAAVKLESNHQDPERRSLQRDIPASKRKLERVAATTEPAALRAEVGRLRSAHILDQPAHILSYAGKYIHSGVVTTAVVTDHMDDH